ncbi:Fur family transcriptional regulator [Desulfitobacterium metallireducens]|uniref:Fur family transcriptional regulator n=1 Tax=Desulfitobacterium metallireducens DSM 15288 TaxID=871968 RepID=W0ECI1_9FIRM|nr:Fur family transcriptional regulator [Desulfitobacterium metallireducens]AHF06766.1 Fur family transcriptional regulator [Desulfitobacterium metallireducens DSM 15288]
MADEQYEIICDRLRDNSYKLTPQRQTILRTFLDNADRHLSAEDVYSLVKHEYPDMGLATVYRTLDLLAELGILQKNDFGDGRSRYEFARKDLHHHHHLICLNCGEVSEFDDDLLESLEAVILKRNHFKVVDHNLKFLGYCRKCQSTLE